MCVVLWIACWCHWTFIIVAHRGSPEQYLIQEVGSVKGSYIECQLYFLGPHNLEFSTQTGHLSQYDNIQQIMTMNNII